MSTILTLRLDPASQAHFNAMRRAHYPPSLNVIEAHLTLFHTLPEPHTLAPDLEPCAERSPFSLRATGLRPLGRGVAYTLASRDLLTLHAGLATAFADHLTPQDRQRFQPHIVVQNKVTPEVARALLARLQHDFQPLDVEAIGLDLWHYRNGPWEPAGFWPFTAQ